jgi:hypothetical protein
MEFFCAVCNVGDAAFLGIVTSGRVSQWKLAASLLEVKVCTFLGCLKANAICQTLKVAATCVIEQHESIVRYILSCYSQRAVSLHLLGMWLF